MIYDRPISNTSRHWLREIAEMEHDATEDIADDTYQATLLTPAGAGSQELRPLVAAPSAPEAAAADHLAVRSARPLGEVVEGGEMTDLTPFALAMLGTCEACE